MEEEIEIEPERFDRLWPLTERRRIEKTRYEIRRRRRADHRARRLRRRAGRARRRRGRVRLRGRRRRLRRARVVRPRGHRRRALQEPAAGARRRPGIGLPGQQQPLIALVAVREARRPRPARRRCLRRGGSPRHEPAFDAPAGFGSRPAPFASRATASGTSRMRRAAGARDRGRLWRSGSRGFAAAVRGSASGVTGWWRATRALTGAASRTAGPSCRRSRSGAMRWRRSCPARTTACTSASAPSTTRSPAGTRPRARSCPSRATAAICASRQRGCAGRTASPSCRAPPRCS